MSTTMQNKQPILEVSDRLYNKKHILKMRNKSSQFNSKGLNKKDKLVKNQKAEILLPKHPVGGEYLSVVKLN